MAPCFLILVTRRLCTANIFCIADAFVTHQRTISYTSCTFIQAISQVYDRHLPKKVKCFSLSLIRLVFKWRNRQSI
jgi:hypothetical protein